MAVSEQINDFFVRDGAQQVLVERSSCLQGAKFQSVLIGERHGVWSGEPPPGVKLMVAKALAKAQGGTTTTTSTSKGTYVQKY